MEPSSRLRAWDGDRYAHRTSASHMVRAPDRPCRPNM